MKTVLLVRHAKSSWENFSVKDEERPLNDRGKRNAPEMAKKLRKKKIAIDVILSSPAKRALTTAQYFAEEYGIKKSRIFVLPELYMAGRDAFLKAIRAVPAEAESVALFSHNNGITEFANLLCETHIDNMPTCGVFAVKCPITEWSGFDVGNNEFYFFDSPKTMK